METVLSAGVSKAAAANSNLTEFELEVELENESVRLRSKIAEMDKVSASKHVDWARAECNPYISFSEFLRSCYYRGWRLCLLSPEQEDTPSRVSY
ncbi:hypothetical protein CUMW_260660 [Citrus unshiu]|uniref:Uncharacterized protein n=1 Tax=Citrus unshiu TaxID=55188 RepID=A0A2H5QTQ4_CITUN|nr:hypothetical protein CUMW_260660 [Citrus unshiu]